MIVAEHDSGGVARYRRLEHFAWVNEGGCQRPDGDEVQADDHIFAIQEDRPEVLTV